MSELDHRDIQELLKKELGRIEDTEPHRDLWPLMLRRLNEGEGRASSPDWADWALIALLALFVFFFPEVVPALLYCL